MGPKTIVTVLILAGLVWGGWIVFGDADRPAFEGSTEPGVAGPAGETRPNVILISVDSLRADHLGSYGYDRPTSPAMDSLAKEGSLFEWVIAGSPRDLPSHMAILTSLPDLVHGVDREGLRLAINHPLLAEVLQEAGYATAAFWAGPYLHPAFGFDRGFDDYINCTSYKKRERDPMSKVLAPPRETRILASEDVTAPRIHDEVSRWLEEKGRRPYFLFIHHWDVHADYIPRAPFDREFDADYRGDFDFRRLEFNDAVNPEMDPRDLRRLVALYDGEIRWTDEWIGRLVALLERKGELDDTLLVITADHGEEFFEHKEQGHGKGLYDESLRVPLILRLPGKVPAGRRSGAPVRTIDVYPTILEVAGIDPPRGILGRSLLGDLGEGGKDPGDVPAAFSELSRGEGGRGLRSLRTASWKLIVDLGEGKSRFFDLEKDPKETAPIPLDQDPRAPEALERMEKLVEVLEALRDSLPRGAAGRLSTLPPEVIERLRSLGYIK